MKPTHLLSISLCAVVLLVLAGATFPATEPRAAISWLTIDEAAGKLEKEQRPVLIDLYTSWCGWCKQMDKKTYSNKAVAAYLNDKFYTVRINAESRKPIIWQGRTYNYDEKNHVNEFAIYLAHGQLEFPTTIFIAPGESPQAIPGYLEPKDFEPLVKYFGDGAYKTRGFDAWQRSFHPTW